MRSYRGDLCDALSLTGQIFVRLGDNRQFPGEIAIYPQTGHFFVRSKLSQITTRSLIHRDGRGVSGCGLQPSQQAVP